MVRKLTSGDHFGELALIKPNEVRTLTVRCGSEHAKLLSLDRNSFNRVLGQIDQYLHRDYSQEMKSFSIVFEAEHKYKNILDDGSLLLN